MPEETIPTTILALLSCFKGCFYARSYTSFATLSVGWILCQGRHSVSRVLQASGPLGEQKHHSTFYRFLSRGKWCVDALGHIIFTLVEPFCSAEITALVDDTLCHRGGPHIFGCCMHFDAGRSTYGRGTKEGRKKFFAFGQNWVILAIRVPLPWNAKAGLAVPVLFRLYRSKKRCPKSLYRKRTELAAELVRILAGWLPENKSLHIVGDSEYACRTLVRDLPGKTSFTGPITLDAAVYAQPKGYAGRGCPRKKGRRLLSPKRLMAARSIPWQRTTLTIYGRKVTLLTKTQMCMWYTVAGTKWVRMVVTKDPAGRIKERAFFSTKEGATVAAVLTQFAYRWEIEVTFRNTKQVLGLQDPQNGWWRVKTGRPKKKAGPNPRGNRGEEAITHTMALAFAAYAIIVVWYFRHGDRKSDVARARREAPWYQHKSAPSFNDMLATIRAELWTARFSAHPLFRRVRQKIRDVLPHWLLAA